MADTTQIIELTIDLDKAVADTVAYQKKVAELKTRLDELKASETATAEEVAMATAEYKAAQKQLSANEKALTQITSANKEEAGTLEKLTAKNAALRKERNALNLETEEGKKRVKEINAELDKNNEVINENSDAAKKQALNIGNYSSAVDGFQNMLSTLPTTLSGVTSGFKSLAIQAWAFIATPIGAVIAAIAAVFGILYAIFKNFDPLLDKIEQGFAAVTAVFSVLKESLLGFISGNKSLSDSFSNLGSSMANAAKEAVKLKEAQQELEDANVALIESSAKSKQQIDELLLQSKDRTKSEEERIALIDKALKIEEDAFKEKQRIAEGEYDTLLKTIANDHLLTDEQAANIKERGINELRALQATKGVTEEEIKALAEASAKRYDILAESTSLREKAINRQNALLDKAAEEDAKRIEKEKEAAEKRNARKQKEAEDEAKRKQKEIDDAKAAAEEAIRLMEYELAKFELTNKGKYDSAQILTQKLVDEEVTRLNQINEKEVALNEEKYKLKLITQEEYNIQSLTLLNDHEAEVAAVQNEWAQVQMADRITAQQMMYDADMELAQDNIFAKLDLEQQALDEKANYELALIDKLAIDKEQKDALALKLSNKYAKADLAIERAKTDAKLALAGGFAENIATIAGEGTAIGKAAAVAQTTISTYQAATSAYSALAGIPIVGPGLGIAAAAAAVASGLANVKQILAVNTDVASGASSSPSTSSSGGSGSITASTLSLPTASSPTIGQGIVSRDATDNSASMIKQGFAEALQENPIQPTLVIDDVTAAQNTSAQNQRSATI